MNYGKRIIRSVVYIGIGVFPVHVFAVDTVGDITGAILHILGGIVPFLAAVATLFFLWTVLIFVKSADNEEQRQKSKSAMVAGIIGLTVIFSLWGIINVLSNTFGVSGVNTSTQNFNDLIVDTPYR
ncbi:MAG: hypothetical protein KAS07_02010 [Candidatus Pacebacteria bacterium]|nr:hypothetical protein [Candidatus Paceibacterota bacterium]